MAKLEKWRVVLYLTIDRDISGKPENWNWNELLDLNSGDEDVYIDESEFVEDIIE